MKIKDMSLDQPLYDITVDLFFPPLSFFNIHPKKPFLLNLTFYYLADLMRYCIFFNVTFYQFSPFIGTNSATSNSAHSNQIFLPKFSQKFQF